MSKTTLDSIILQYRAELNQGLNELAGHGTPEEQLKQAILRWVADEIILAGRKLQKRELWGESADVLLDHIIENQEAVLAQHGYKGGKQC